MIQASFLSVSFEWYWCMVSDIVWYILLPAFISLTILLLRGWCMYQIIGTWPVTLHNCNIKKISRVVCYKWLFIFPGIKRGKENMSPWTGVLKLTKSCGRRCPVCNFITQIPMGMTDLSHPHCPSLVRIVVAKFSINLNPSKKLHIM